MGVRRVVPDLKSGDLLAAVAFYTSVLGFRVVMDLGWVVTQVRATPGGRPTFIPPPWIDPQQQPRRNTYHRRC
ncbi:hypothetical protein [Plantactinospora sp. GCM10030261]|uniref:hypothetical protein n=1 Tax=Plantactinospora sp. GCM10030261 TaxID=3273420 RepID=UPI00360E28E8